MAIEASKSDLLGLEYLQQLQKLEGIKFTPLETARRLLAALGNPQDEFPTIHVAGTNGKGTVCSLLSAMLFSAGYKVGQTSSPHLSKLTERCLINGRAVRESHFNQSLQTVIDLAERENLQLSFFVLALIASYLEFRREKVDWAVVEVGLGGRFDATNLLAKPRACVISSIGFDHTELLGNTLAEIAGNKAGIAKAACPMFVGSLAAEAESAVKEICQQVGAPLFIQGRDFEQQPELLENLALSGNYQRQNATVAVAVAEHLGLSREAISQGLNRARWPGRLERFQLKRDAESLDVLLDVAHNVQGMQALLEFMRSEILGKYSRISVVFGALERKAWREMLECWRELLAERPENESENKSSSLEFFLATVSHPEAADAENLKAHLGCGRAFPNPAEAMEAAISQTPQKGLLLITGSVYFVGELRAAILSEEFSSLAV